MNLDNSSFSPGPLFYLHFLNCKCKTKSAIFVSWPTLSFIIFLLMLNPRSITPFFLIIDTLSFPFFPNKYRFGFISWLEFQSIFSDSKLFRYFMPRTLMTVQAIWRMKLLVHHEESSRTNWIIPLAHNPAQVGWRIQSTTKESSLKPEQGYDTLTTTTITKVESTLDTLKEVRVIHDKAGRYNQA